MEDEIVDDRSLQWKDLPEDDRLHIVHLAIAAGGIAPDILLDMETCFALYCTDKSFRDTTITALGELTVIEFDEPPSRGSGKAVMSLPHRVAGHILLHCHSLKSIDVTRFRMTFCWDTLFTPLSKLSTLERIDASFGIHLGPETLDAFAQHSNCRLRELELQGNATFDHQREMMFLKHPSMQNLELLNCAWWRSFKPPKGWLTLFSSASSPSTDSNNDAAGDGAAGGSGGSIDNSSDETDKPHGIEKERELNQNTATASTAAPLPPPPPPPTITKKTQRGLRFLNIAGCESIDLTEFTRDPESLLLEHLVAAFIPDVDDEFLAAVGKMPRMKMLVLASRESNNLWACGKYTEAGLRRLPKRIEVRLVSAV